MSERSRLLIMQANLFRILSVVLLFVVLLCVSSCSKIEIKWQSVKSPDEINKTLLKVYIENSGSMDGYMCDGAELKDCLLYTSPSPRDRG